MNRISKLFQPINAIPKNFEAKHSDITSKGQRLLLECGIIQHSIPGCFHILPLGLRVIDKLTKLIVNEMSQIEAQKMCFPHLTAAKLWKITGRLDKCKAELFHVKDRHDSSYILSPTFEEVAAELFSGTLPVSYKQFPVRLYQITNKFRDEMKPRFGLMRARQFLMKDLYTFDVSKEEALRTYKMVCQSYHKIFQKIAVPYVQVLGDSGVMGGSMSHEFQFPAEIGEDKLHICNSCGYSINAQLSKSENTCPNCSKIIEEVNGIEVGHTFFLGDKYTKPLKGQFLASNGKPQILQMGSYGLGVSRIVAASVEILSKEHEIRWPSVLSPYKLVLIGPKEGSKEQRSNAVNVENLYEDLNQLEGLHGDVIYDDRTQLTIGKRELEAKRTGYPFAVIIGAKSTEKTPLLEVLDVYNDQRYFLNKEQLVDFFKEKESVQVEPLANKL